MKNLPSFKDILIKLPGIIILTLAFGSIAFAWTPPTTTAPGGNVAGPLTTGTGNQVKSASLGVTGDFAIGASGTSQSICLNGSCISVWPTSSAAGLTMDGYAVSYVNSDEDSYGISSAWNGVKDTCDGDLSATYICPPSTTKSCTDVSGGAYFFQYDPNSGSNNTTYTGGKRLVNCAAATAYVKLPGVETKSVSYVPDQATYTVDTSKAYSTFWLSDPGELPGYDAGYPIFTAFPADGAWHTVWNWTCDNGNWMQVKYSDKTFSVKARGDEDCNYPYRHGTHTIKASFR